MKATPLERAEQARLQAERVRALADNLRALLDGRMTRAELLAWTRELRPPGCINWSPFTATTAAIVFDSLSGLGELEAGREIVRDIDLRAYSYWLTEGDALHVQGELLLVLERDIDDLAAQLGGEALHWCREGIGWQALLRFSGPASGCPFAAHALLGGSGLNIVTQRGVDRHDALVDLFETLAIDDADASRINPDVELTRLPVWALWRQDDNGNRFEMARTRSYAKACAQERMFTARGHKQNYWVEPV